MWAGSDENPKFPPGRPPFMTFRSPKVLEVDSRGKGHSALGKRKKPPSVEWEHLERVKRYEGLLSQAERVIERDPKVALVVVAKRERRARRCPGTEIGRPVEGTDCAIAKGPFRLTGRAAGFGEDDAIGAQQHELSSFRVPNQPSQMEAVKPINDTTRLDVSDNH